ncbi:hypothetical protein ACN6MY_08915 [Peribacillus sp. B-H-3]
MMVKKVYETTNKIAKMVLLVLLFTLHDPKNGYVGVLQAKTGTG